MIPRLPPFGMLKLMLYSVFSLVPPAKLDLFGDSVSGVFETLPE